MPDQLSVVGKPGSRHRPPSYGQLLELADEFPLNVIVMRFAGTPSLNETEQKLLREHIEEHFDKLLGMTKEKPVTHPIFVTAAGSLHPIYFTGASMDCPCPSRQNRKLM